MEPTTVMPQPHPDAWRVERRAPATAPAVGPLRRAVIVLARRAGFGLERLDDIELAVSEILTNVVMHAYEGSEPGEVAVRADVDADALHVDVVDAGTGFRHRHDSPGLGLGLALAAMLADDLRIAPGRTAGTVVTLRFDRPAT